MSTLEELRARYRSGGLPKPEYVDRMHELHRQLFAYADYLKTGEVEAIELRAGQVIVTLKEGGIRLVCDVTDRRTAPVDALNFGSYERNEINALGSTLSGDETMLDVGANIGWYSLVLARRFPRLRVFAFEPVPPTYAQLERNLALNGLADRVRTFPFALSDRDGEIEIFYRPDCTVNASAVDHSPRGDSLKVKCALKRADAFVAEQGISVGLMKVDVEGAELMVLRGAEKTLAGQRPVVFAEMLRKWSARFGYHPNEMIAFMAGLGYRCFGVGGARPAELRVMDDSTSETNFVFLHSEKHRERIAAWDSDPAG